MTEDKIKDSKGNMVFFLLTTICLVILPVWAYSIKVYLGSVMVSFSAGVNFLACVREYQNI